MGRRNKNFIVTVIWKSFSVYRVSQYQTGVLVLSQTEKIKGYRQNKEKRNCDCTGIQTQVSEEEAFLTLAIVLPIIEVMPLFF